MKPKLAKELKTILTSVFFALTMLLSPCAKAETSGYITQYSIDTAHLSDWTAEANTKLSTDTVERNGSGVVSFSGMTGKTTLGASYALINLPPREFDNSNLTLKLLLYISDAQALRGGKISLIGNTAADETVEAEEDTAGTETDESETVSVAVAEKVYYEWDVSDLDLKTGWNRLMLNFNTAKGYEYSDSFTFNGITELNIRLLKQASPALTAALDNTEIAVYSLESADVPLTPITDEFSTGEILIAVAVTSALFGGIIIFCWLKAKKEAIRRKRARQAKMRTERKDK